MQVARHEVLSEVTGNVGEIEAAVGDRLGEGDTIMILESMKMEIPVEATAAGTLVELRVQKEDAVEEDQVLAVIEPD